MDEGDIMEASRIATTCRAYTIASRSRAIERVISRMRERLDEPLSLREMAKIAYISPFHFNRVFRQITGIPPSQFLYALRLEAAKRLLLTTSLSVTDICFDVGYNSLGTFTTRFSQLVGLSPCHLRQLAEGLQSFTIESLSDENLELPEEASLRASITGHIKAPDESARAIFVGLFPTCIPQSQPLGGTLLTQPGEFRIGPVPDGIYHMFVAAFPLSDNPLTYLLPEPMTLLVGTARSPLVVQDGRSNVPVEVILRPVRLTDPPILIALPSLLGKRMEMKGPASA
jgi:AraC family transcriptional regulator